MLGEVTVFSSQITELITNCSLQAKQNDAEAANLWLYLKDSPLDSVWCLKQTLDEGLDLKVLWCCSVICVCVFDFTSSADDLRQAASCLLY